MEHQDHWTHEITLSGLYSGTDNVANLQLAIRQAQQAATADQGWAAQAPPGSAAARELQAVAHYQDAINERPRLSTVADSQPRAANIACSQKLANGPGHHTR